MPYGAYGNPMMNFPGYGNNMLSNQGQSQPQPNQATVSTVPPVPNPPSVPSEPESQPPSLVPKPPGGGAATSPPGGDSILPEGSSTPKHVPLPQFSPISPPKANDRSRCSTVVMGDLSINASSLTSSVGSVYSSQEKDMSQSGLIGLNNVVENTEPGSRVPGDQPPVHHVLDPKLDNANMDINNNAQQNNLDPTENPPQDNSEDKVKEMPTFPQNMERQPLLSNARRITLAYKYYPFEKKPPEPSKPVSEARASDDDVASTAAVKPEDALESSFPVSGYITKSWKYRDTKFRESLKKGLSMKPPPKESQTEEDDDDDGFTLYSANFASILKNKPDKKQSDFHYHKAKFSNFVELDPDINKLRRDDTKEWEMRVKLSSPEIKNIQTAMAYTLMAQSHASAYIRASRAALNQILLTLNPDEHSENIQRIRDIKQLMEGLVMCKEQTVTDSVYVHSGLTAQLRTDFLKAQGSYLPLHTKQALLHESLGGNALFDHQISLYESEVVAHNAKLHQQKMDSAVVKSLDGYKITKRNDSAPPPPPPQQSAGNWDSRSRGQQKFHDNYYDNKGNKNKNKGRGGQNKGNTPNHNNNRGRGRGGGGGAQRGRKQRN